jgi:hypothetical protein
LTKKKDTSATKANKEASASATVFAHSGITKSMLGTAFIACLMNVDFARLPPLSLLMARDSYLSLPWARKGIKLERRRTKQQGQKLHDTSGM